MQNHLTVILGAGFSANAGMLTAKGIKKRFDRDLRDKLLCHSSSKWFWIDDKDDTFIHNGQLNYDSLIYSYIFNELVKCYKEEKGSFGYYEYFYQYIIDNSANKQWLEHVYKKVKKIFLEDYPLLLEPANRSNSEIHYLFELENIQVRKISDILNYLIQDCLIIKNEDKELEKIYQDFIEYISIFENVDIFTLNHDLLLEQILNLNELKFSRGFNIENSPITHEGSPVPFFNNTFTEKIRIHKLHGSFDFFMMKHYENNGLFHQLTDQYDYFTTDDPMVKHFAHKETEKNQQKKINLDIVPKFITGTRKLDTINQDILFEKLFQNFQETISKTENLLISGYSFSDEHLNKHLKQREFHFINQNPEKEYPFKGKGHNIKILADLKNLI